jgi:hypothetical protein
MAVFISLWVPRLLFKSQRQLLITDRLLTKKKEPAVKTTKRKIEVRLGEKFITVVTGTSVVRLH